MVTADIGILGGSGFYNLNCINQAKSIEMDTPFGKPSDNILLGQINKKSVAFISRHGQGHLYNPSEVPYRANLWALKQLDVKKIVSVSAVGSLKEELEPTHLVIPDQFIDNTYKRQKTYFENGIAAHVSMDEPTCHNLAEIAHTIAQEIGIPSHRKGTYYNMEGPQFSTRAESTTYRKLGYSIIGMTLASEAKLARELEMCFLPLAFVTDYDCWYHEFEVVSVEIIIKNFAKNNENAGILVERLVDQMSRDQSNCKCSQSLNGAIITDPESITSSVYERLKPILNKYIKPPKK